jgi:hypothetical protein
MEHLVINKEENIKKLTKSYLKFNSRKTVFVFDIHKTALTREGDIDKEIYKLIKEILKANYTVLFLSYDGNGKRIPENNERLNAKRLYKPLQKIFIKKRTKGLVISAISEMIDFDERLNYHVVLIDDKTHNTNDVNDIGDETLIGYHYHGKNKDLKNFRKMFSFLKPKHHVYHS